MSRRFLDDIDERLKDVGYAQAFGAAAAKTDLALTIAEARFRQGVTQVQLANKLGKTQSYIAKLERGDANPTIGTIGKLLAAIGMRLSTNTLPLEPRLLLVPKTEELSHRNTKEVRHDFGPPPMIEAQFKSDSGYKVFNSLGV